MEELLKQAELFEGLTREELRHVAAIGRLRTLRAGEYLFFLGEDAADLSVVTQGSIDLCFPMRLRSEVKDVAVETIHEGEALGWSALVRPYRFTLSARASEPSEVISFARQRLTECFAADPRIGYVCSTRISEIVGVRLIRFQALWARELQRLAERPHVMRG